MRFLKTVISVFFLSAALMLDAAPARRGILRLSQPDGTVVEARLIGDEFGHVMTTADGCAIGWGSDGFLCYASYDASGRKLISGRRVGTPGSESLIAASRHIPYGLIGRKAAARKANVFSGAGAPRVSIATKSSPKPINAIVILAQFSDLSFKYGREYFVDMMIKHGYDFNGSSGSALDYFNDQFEGKAEFHFDVGPVVTLPKGYAYYGEDDEDGHDIRPADAVAEACRMSDPQVDFSRYDFIYVIYAGPNPADGSADDDHIWPHSWDLPSAGISLFLDGVQITGYGASSELQNNWSGGTELTGIGTFCHEFSHAIGLPDLYDTDYEKSGGESEAMWGSTSLMDQGNYNNNGHTPSGYNAVESEILGILTAEPVKTGHQTLSPINKSRRALRMETDTEGEYFLVECRATTGWDKYIGGSGLLIYHIDKSERPAGYSSTFEKTLTARQRWSSEYNEVNCRPDHQCADIVEAYPSASSLSQVFFPYMTIDSFSFKTDPSFSYWSGAPSIFSIRNIKKNGSDVSFDIDGPITLDIKDVYQDAAILCWHSDMDFCKKFPTYLSWTDGSGESSEVKVEPYADGLYSYTIEGLSDASSYHITIGYKIEDLDDYPLEADLTTSTYNGLPFIYMGDTSRRDVSGQHSNRIPLRVFNAKNATEVKWYMSDREIHTAEDGYYTVTGPGVLKAVVNYKDGTQDIMVREVTAR